MNVKTAGIPINMNGTVSGETSSRSVTLVELKALSFLSPVSGLAVNCDECTDIEFRMFVSRCVDLQGEGLDTWTLEERRDVLNFIFSNNGPQPEFLEGVEDEQDQSAPPLPGD
jgi:hypothetical protein